MSGKMTPKEIEESYQEMVRANAAAYAAGWRLKNGNYTRAIPMTTDELNAAAAREAMAKLPVVAGNVGLVDDKGLNERFAEKIAEGVARLEEKYKDAELPPPGLWAPGEVDELKEQLAAAAGSEAGRRSRRFDVDPRGNLTELVDDEKLQGFGKPVELDDTPGDATGDLAHIRELILSDFPQAGTATDEELEALYDEWAAQHGE